jgi:hypothetical protein
VIRRPRHRGRELGVIEFAGPQHRRLHRPSRPRCLGPDFQLPRLVVVTAPGREDQRAVLRAEERRIRQVQAEFFDRPPLRGIIGPHRALITEGMMVRIIHHMQVARGVHRQRRPAMVVGRLADRPGLRPPPGRMIERADLDPETLGWRVQPGHMRAALVGDDLARLEVGRGPAAAFGGKQKTLRRPGRRCAEADLQAQQH